MRGIARVVAVVAAMASGVMGYSANAAPVTYNEAVDGDLGEFPGPTFVFDTVGTQTITGSSSYAGVLNADLDSFKFDIAPGLRVVAITLEATSFGDVATAWFLDGLFGLEPL